MVKPRTKKTLIITITSLFLGGISFLEYKSNNDYYFAKDHNLTQKTQKIFWSRIDEDSMEKMGVGGSFFSEGGLGVLSDAPKHFDLKLNDQWGAQYSYEHWKNGYILSIAVYRFGESVNNGFSFYVNPMELTIINDDKKYRINTYLVSPDERQQIDRETTPDSITDTDHLEKLALKKFVEFQDQYFKVN